MTSLPKSAVQFSGGKDSLALVYHLQALLPHMDVVMVDTGDMPHHAYRNAELAQSIAPNFIILRSPPRTTTPTSEDWPLCCATHIWEPMAAFIQDAGYRQVFRGAKRCDPHFHGVYPGDEVNGVVYTMPLWDWSDHDVYAYLADKLPDPYTRGARGMPDCMSCPVPESCGGHTRDLWRE